MDKTNLNLRQSILESTIGSAIRCAAEHSEPRKRAFLHIVQELKRLRDPEIAIQIERPAQQQRSAA